MRGHAHSCKCLGCRAVRRQHRLLIERLVIRVLTIEAREGMAA